MQAKYVRARLRGSKTPERIVVWDELPRNDIGKMCGAKPKPGSHTSAPDGGAIGKAAADGHPHLAAGAFQLRH